MADVRVTGTKREGTEDASFFGQTRFFLFPSIPFCPLPSSSRWTTRVIIIIIEIARRP